jgi:RNA polymerase sigma-B factor
MSGTRASTQTLSPIGSGDTSVWPVHVPRGMQEGALSVNRATRELAEKTGRHPTIAELGKRLDLDQREILEGLRAREAFDSLSLDAPASANEDAEPRTRGETIGSDDRGYELADDRLTIAAALRRLSTRERRVIHMRFAEDRTQSDIASRIGVSQMQVSRILRRTLERLQLTVEGSMAPAAR